MSLAEYPSMIIKIHRRAIKIIASSLKREIQIRMANTRGLRDRRWSMNNDDMLLLYSTAITL